jgi:glycosyltransferase involved in cell wall biosynthesis
MVNDPPAVSIAIRAFRDRWLSEAIDGVLDGDLEDLELVVYDDRGDLEEIAARRGDPRVRYHRATERRDEAGRFAAAAALCRGEFLGLLDDDDRYEPGFLAAAVAALRDDPGAGVAFARGAWLTPGGVVVPADGRPSGRRPELAADLLGFRAFVPPSLMLMRRSAFESMQATRPFPDGVAPDAWVHIALAELGWSAVLIGDAPLVQRRWHPEQMSRSALGARIVVRTWSELATSDPELDAVRRRVLARKRVRLGLNLLAAGDRGGCRLELAAAVRDDPASWRTPRRVTSGLSRVPVLGPLLASVALRVERRTLSAPPPFWRPAG